MEDLQWWEEKTVVNCNAGIHEENNKNFKQIENYVNMLYNVKQVMALFAQKIANFSS